MLEKLSLLSVLIDRADERKGLLKLARTTPALQVNIAAAGGQQVNLLGSEPGGGE